MGYTTKFSGEITVSPPLNPEEIDFLNKFSSTRRMNREKGPYFVDGEGFMGQANSEDVIDYNDPPQEQPGLWCQWVPNKDGTAIEWDDEEKFYAPVEWMKYLIEHFLSPEAKAVTSLPFLQANHSLNGVIKAQGEDIDDRWKLIVIDNVVSVEELE